MELEGRAAVDMVVDIAVAWLVEYALEEIADSNNQGQFSLVYLDCFPADGRPDQNRFYRKDADIGF